MFLARTNYVKHRLMKFITKIALAAISFVIVGCASTPESLSAVKVGMSKSDVIDVMGSPQSVSAQGKTEYLTYSFCIDKCVAPPIYRVYVPFFVRLQSGVVDSFGKTGDFDSTKTPTSRVEIDRTDRIIQDGKNTDPNDIYGELRKLKELLDAGVINQEDFNTRKQVLLRK